MKKIIFVQKQDQHSYDPVNAFFGSKKTSSIAKPPTANTTNKLETNVIKKNISNQATNNIKNTNNQIMTGKIGKKGQYNLAKGSSKNLKHKEEIIYDLKIQKEIEKEKKQTQQYDKKELFTFKSTQNENEEEFVEKQVKIKKNQQKNKAIDHKAINQNNQKLIKQINQLKIRVEQYTLKLQEYEEKQELFFKGEQKLAKLQKQMKANLQKLKENNELGQKLKQKEEIIKELMKKETIPYNKKREVILCNQMKELKRINRDLTLRIKNYKGTDLVEMAAQRNKNQIAHDMDYHQDIDLKSSNRKEEMNIELESTVSKLIQNLNEYISSKLFQKGETLTWAEEHKRICDLVNISEQISLNILQNYDICVIPQSNQEANHLYEEMQDFKNRCGLNKLVDKFQMNLILSQQNLAILNQLEDNTQEMLSIKEQIVKKIKEIKPKKHDKKANVLECLRIYQKRSNYNQTLLVQSICQLSFLKQWIQRSHLKLLEQLSVISQTVKQIKTIAEVGGEAAKESLFLYIHTNLQHLTTKFTDIKIKIKQIQSAYKDIQKYKIPLKN